MHLPILGAQEAPKPMAAQPATEKGRDAATPEAVFGTWEEVGAEGALGTPGTHAVALGPDELRRLYELMALARRVDRQALTLTRQGLLGVFASSLGQEAAQVASVLALDDADWLFPTYRDTVGVFARGVDIVEILALFQGSWHCGYDPMLHRVAPQATPLATQTLHAVGLAMAARLRRDPVVSLVLLGDGASSEGDTHEAMNIAGVMRAPCVFLVQNNQYAISVPLRLQTAAPSLAVRAGGYGIAGARVDGNDAVSVYGVVREAVSRARRGLGPTLVEAMTYRMEAHTSADDPSRYRSDDEVEHWRARDPLARLLDVLQRRGLLSEPFLAEVEAKGESLAARMRQSLQATPEGDPLEMFDHVYASMPEALRSQRSDVADLLSLAQRGAA